MGGNGRRGRGGRHMVDGGDSTGPSERLLPRSGKPGQRPSYVGIEVHGLPRRFPCDSRRCRCHKLGGRHARIRSEMPGLSSGGRASSRGERKCSPGLLFLPPGPSGHPGLAVADGRRGLHAIATRPSIGISTANRASMSGLANVTRFDQEHHPEFASAQKDPGHLKFSHYRHLTPGLVNNLGEEKTILTLARIPDPAQRERYRRPGQSDDSPVQLDCGSCHQLDGGDFGIPRPANSFLLLAACRARRVTTCCRSSTRTSARHAIRFIRRPESSSTVKRRHEIARPCSGHLPRSISKATRNCWSRFVPPEPLPNARPPRTQTVARRIQE